jgi:hypothetical protein
MLGHITVAAIVALALGAGVVSAFSRFIKVRNPDVSADAGGPATTAIAIPRLAPPDNVPYLAHGGSQPVKAPDGRPVAQLASTPPNLAQAVAVNFPDGPADAAGEVAFRVLSSIRYTGSGHTVLVTTARPSAAALQETISLGNQTVRMSDGSTGYIGTGMPGNLSNQLAWVKDDLIITLASDLPIDNLKQLAASIILQQ